MRNIDGAILDEIKKEVTSTFFLLELNLTEDHYYTDRDHNIYYGGHNYLATGFEFSNIVYAANMTVDKVTVDIDNTGLAFSALLLGEDIRNKTAKLSFGCYGEEGTLWDSEVAWDSEVQWLQRQVILGTVDLFRGILSDWQLSELKASITFVNEFVLWKKKTLRIAQASCPWTFKETECSYSGVESWCDQSYERCQALGNTDNFGGFRFLPSIMEKELWWGRVQAL